MTDHELLQAIDKMMDKKIQPMEKSITELREDVGNLQTDMQVVKQKVTLLELTLENETNHNIQLLAENHMNLIDKLNQAIRVSDKTLLYEVQVSSLKSKVEHLEKEIAEIKEKIA